MIDVDFQNEEVQRVVGKLASETGMSIEEILKEYEYYGKKTYVRFTKGVNKGKVGYYFPSPQINPYSMVIYCKDCEILTMGWNNNYEVISEEEYLKEHADDKTI